MGSNLMDEIDCGSFFDHIDDLIECPPDNDTGLGSGSCNDFPNIWTNTSEDLLDSDPIFSGRNINGASDLSAELAVPVSFILKSFQFCQDFVNFVCYSVTLPSF